MMLIMTEVFLNLIAVFTETKNTDLKADWPIVDGTKNKLGSWYLTILSQVTVPPWSELYDTMSNDLMI